LQEFCTDDFSVTKQKE